MGDVFRLKYRDTRPILEVALKNPDGTPHDLTGSTAWKLHIRVSAALTLTRDLVKFGADGDGVLRYTWVATDWDTGNLPIVSSTSLKVLPMEYEIFGGTQRMTFPNSGYDRLEIRGDLV